MEIKTEQRKISQIKRNPNNPRAIKDHKFKQLVESIKSFPEMLEIRPIVVNADGVVLGGNMRLAACKEAGLKEIPVINAKDLTEDQQREFIIKDNVGFGEWDWELLANEWDKDELEAWGLELQMWPEEEPDAEEDDYDIPDEIETDIVLGDLFEIGPHRLLCGDSTDPDNIEKLISGESDIVVMADPPYGIEVVKSTVGGSKAFGTVGAKNVVEANQYSPIIGDDTTETAEAFYNSCISVGIEAFCVWGGNYFTKFLPPRKCWLVWDKKGREWDDNFSDFEMAWTSSEKPAKIYTHVWMGMVQSGEREKRVHPTQKPTKLIGECLQYMGNHQCVFDGFLGSGTTMVAAHQLNRKCYGMELDPKYCQVIIDRMRQLDPSIEIKKNGESYA